MGKKVLKKIVKKVVKRVLARAALKTGAKKVPGVGLIFGIGSGIWEACKGNWTQAVL